MIAVDASSDHREEPDRRDPAPAAMLLGTVVLAELLAIGANTDLLAVAAAVGEIVAAIVVLGWLLPSRAFWTAAAPLLVAALILCLLAATPWVAGIIGDSPTLSAVRADQLTPDLSLARAARAFGAFALLIAGSAVGWRRGGAHWIGLAIMLAGGIDLLVGLALREIDPEHVWQLGKRIHVHRFSGTMLNANATGCVLAIVAVLALGRAQTLAGILRFRTRSLHSEPILAAGYTLLAVAALGGCAITASRTSLTLALVAMMAVAARPLLLRRRQRQPAWMIAVVVLLLIGVVLVAGQAMSRFDHISRDGEIRWTIWTPYLAAIRSVPVLGYGLDSIPLLNQRLMTDPSQAKLLWYINSAHNFVLSLILQQGWLIAVGLLILAAGMVLTIARHRRRRLGDAIPTSMVAAIGIVMGCASVDIALDVPAVVAILVLVGGALWGRALRVRDDHLVAARSKAQPLIAS